MRGIFKTEMKTVFYPAEKCRAGFIGMVTDRDNIIPFLIKVFINKMGGVMADVYAKLSHYLHSLGVYPGCRLSASGLYNKLFVK